MDPLSDVFRTLRVSSTLYFRAHLGAPFGLEVEPCPGTTRFHVVVAGQCWVEVDAHSPVFLEKGDLILVPHGARHRILSEDRGPSVPLEAALEQTEFRGGSPLKYGGTGRESVLVCGHFEVQDEASHPVLDDLPPSIVVRASEGFDFSWLDAATQSLGREAEQRLAGWEVIVDRVSEILFVQVLRAYTSTGNTAIAAFSDERLAPALAAIHREPATSWTVDRLARLAGLSRTGFAVRFREMMGLTPMAYLTRWRLQRARNALLGSEQAMAQIAEEFGYHSEAAFSRAFQRLYGKPPAGYRRSILQSRA